MSMFVRRFHFSAVVNLNFRNDAYKIEIHSFSD